MNSDFHIHLKNGVSNIEIIKEYLDKCLEKKIDKVLFLDHGNRISQNHKPVLYNKEIILDFFKNIDSVRDLYPGITIYKGIEVDYSIDKDFCDNEITLMKLGFDYIIGSVHGYKNYSKDEYYKRNLDMLDIYPINILGHLRLWDDYLDYSLVIEEIVKNCGQKGISIEISTSARAMWSKEQYLFMNNLINKYNVTTTVGSDAHNVDEIAINFELLKEYKGD